MASYQRVNGLIESYWLSALLVLFLLIPFSRPLVEDIQRDTGVSFKLFCGARPERQLMSALLPPMLLCARCCGLCFGLASAAFWRPALAAPAPRAAALCCLGLLCLGLDWLTEALRMRPPYSPTRVLTGYLFGYWAACYAYAARRRPRHARLA